MYPPIYATCLADSGVTNIFGTSPLRIYPFGFAGAGVIKPYAVWQVVGGSPLNCMSGTPDMDQYTLQIDVYALEAGQAREGAEAIRDAIEAECHIVSWRGESRDFETQNYRFSFDADWFVDRDTASA